MNHDIMTREEIEALDGHVPGPWEKDNYGQLFGQRGAYICQVHHPATERLISAAPDLKTTALALHEKMDRLTDENKELRETNTKACEVIIGRTRSLDKLEAENAELRNAVDLLIQERDEYHEELDRVEAENAQLRERVEELSNIRLGRCRGCGEWITVGMYEGWEGHTVAVADDDGDPMPAPCGPIDFGADS